jgi:type IV secretory pathway VirB3-like protein
MSLLEYDTTPLLALALVALTENEASVMNLVDGGDTNASVGVPFETVSVLVRLPDVNWFGTATCDAVNVTSPTPSIFIQSPEVSIVATAVLSLVYVIAPLLLLMGRVKIANDGSPYALLVFAMVNVAEESVGVPRETVRVLLIRVLLENWLGTAACNALKITSPSPTIFIQFPEASIVATAGVLLVYVIAPLLLVVGRVIIANDASP